MRAILVEDDAAKAARIVEFVESLVADIDIRVARSYKSGLQALLEGAYDFALLDMTLPTFDISAAEHGGKPLIFGGKELLRQMKRRKISTPTVVTTQFEQFGSGVDVVTRDALEEELSNEYDGLFVGMVYYHATEEIWKYHLSDILRRSVDGVE